MRIPESGLIQFLKSRGADADAEKVLARLAAGPSSGIETKPTEREKEREQESETVLPRLDLSDSSPTRNEPPRPPSARSETVEKMFPLDAEALQEVHSRLAPATSATGGTQEKNPRRRTPAKAPPVEEAVQQIEQWMHKEKEEPTVEALPPEPAREAPPPSAVKEPELLEPAEREVLLGRTEPATPPEQPPAPQEEELAAAEAPASVDESMQAAMTLVRTALARRASEVHIESTASAPLIRLRIDGLLHDATRCDACPLIQTAALALQQLLELVGTRTADARRPSRGQVDLLVDGREVAVTVGTCPTTMGQRVVVSLRDSQLLAPGLSLLGLSQETQKHLAAVLAGPGGLVLLLARPGNERTQALEAVVSAMDISNRSIVAVARKPALAQRA